MWMEICMNLLIHHFDVYVVFDLSCYNLDIILMYAKTNDSYLDLQYKLL